MIRLFNGFPQKPLQSAQTKFASSTEKPRPVTPPASENAAQGSATNLSAGLSERLSKDSERKDSFSSQKRRTVRFAPTVQVYCPSTGTMLEREHNASFSTDNHSTTRKAPRRPISR